MQAAWQEDRPSEPFPWAQVEVRHIADLLDSLLPQQGLYRRDYDYDAAAANYLQRAPASEPRPAFYAV